MYDLELPSGEKVERIDAEYNMNNPDAGYTYRLVGGDSGERPLKPGTRIEVSEDGGTTWNLNCIIKSAHPDGPAVKLAFLLHLNSILLLGFAEL